MGVVGVHDNALTSGHTRLTNPLTVYLSVAYLPVTDVGERLDWPIELSMGSLEISTPAEHFKRNLIICTLYKMRQ